MPENKPKTTKKAAAKTEARTSPTFKAAEADKTKSATAATTDTDAYAELQAALDGFERPEGMPKTLPYQALSRRDRAFILRAATELDSNKLAGLSTDPDAATVMDTYEVLAVFEEALQAAAEDKAAMHAWTRAVDDEALTAGFMAFILDSDLGKLNG